MSLSLSSFALLDHCLKRTISFSLEIEHFPIHVLYEKLFNRKDGMYSLSSMQVRIVTSLSHNFCSLVAEEENNQTEVLKKNLENEANANQTARISSLEAELKDMQERYLNMSLQFAEVEAQREQLVMKLKSTNKEKRWF